MRGSCNPQEDRQPSRRCRRNSTSILQKENRRTGAWRRRSREATRWCGMTSVLYMAVALVGLTGRASGAVVPPPYSNGPKWSNGLSPSSPPPPPPPSSQPPPYHMSPSPPPLPPPRSPPASERKRPSLGDLVSRFGEVIKSPEFAQLAENIGQVVEEVSGQKVDIQEGVLGMVQRADEALGGFAEVAEKALKSYRGVHGEMDGLFREGFVKLIKRALSKLMTEESIQTSLQVVNATVALVQEHMAEVAHVTDNRTEAEHIVLMRMAKTAEDVEALSLSLVNSTLFTRFYPEDGPYYAGLIQARLVPRLVLAVTSSLLHGLDPLSDPIYALLVVAFASGTLTKDLTSAILSRLQVTISGDMITDNWLFNRLPDVWRTSERAVDMGEGLNALFGDLEQRGLIGGPEGGEWWKGRHSRKGATLMHATRALNLGRSHGVKVVSVLLALLVAVVLACLIMRGGKNHRA